MTMDILQERGRRFRAVIESFIKERWDAKRKGKSDEEQAIDAPNYEYATWLAEAARRVEQIQAVTHILKATHPYAKGTSLHVTSLPFIDHGEVGSYSLRNQERDVVGNAAALDVYKFLKLEVENRQLLSWFEADDEDLLAALNADLDLSRTWAAAFKRLERTPEKFVSHSKAKQLYWSVSGEPTENEGFHLLQPLFSSSFAQELHHDIQETLYGEANKEARKARREGKAHDAVNRVYMQLAVRKIGGTKPQNISQLNSERGGINYLLASLPPTWDQNNYPNLLAVGSALTGFRNYDGVNVLLKNLQTMLKDSPKASIETRTRREVIEKALGQSLAAFGAEIRQSLEPGWSRNVSCSLPLYEKLWLDCDRRELPVREAHAQIDQEFIDTYKRQEWPDEVAQGFAAWLNSVLRKAGLPVGDVEHVHWARQARQAIVDVDWSKVHQRDFISVKS